MSPIQPPVPFHIAADSSIIDASTLLYRPADRVTAAEEQIALFAAREALARWTSGSAAPIATPNGGGEPFRAAYFARARQDFVSWIKRGGMWEGPRDAAAAQTTMDALPADAAGSQAIDACE